MTVSISGDYDNFTFLVSIWTSLSPVTKTPAAKTRLPERSRRGRRTASCARFRYPGSRRVVDRYTSRLQGCRKSASTKVWERYSEPRELFELGDEHCQATPGASMQSPKRLAGQQDWLLLPRVFKKEAKKKIRASSRSGRAQPIRSGLTNIARRMRLVRQWQNSCFRRLPARVSDDRTRSDLSNRKANPTETLSEYADSVSRLERSDPFAAPIYP